ncbi:MAG: RNA pyrophosphohydrolase [Gammaproteobacteria bacterium]
MHSKLLRKNVGLIILNHTNELLLCKRKDSTNWQFPQGGIDKGETEEQAAMRELYEEVGIQKSDIHILMISSKWYEYIVPNKYKRKSPALKGFNGQLQKWFLIKFKAEIEPVITFTNDHCHEFDDFKWVSYWYPLGKIISFKKEVYKNIMFEFLPMYNSLK